MKSDFDFTNTYIDLHISVTSFTYVEDRWYFMYSIK